jgi:hypothetical protein
VFWANILVLSSELQICCVMGILNVNVMGGKQKTGILYLLLLVEIN